MRHHLALLFLGFIGLGVTGVSAAHGAASAKSSDSLRIGLSLQPSNALVMVALDRGYLASEGLNVSVKEYVSGTRALRNGLFTGEVDLTTASDVPVVLNRFERRDFKVIATIFRVDNQNRIIARSDRGISKPADLKGKRIATQRGSAVHFFLHLFLLENNIAKEDVHLSFMKAGELPGAFARGDIDAFSMREPYIGQAKSLLRDRVNIFAAPGLYSQSDLVVIADNYLQANENVAKKVIRALVRAERFVAGNPAKSQGIVARYLRSRPEAIVASWPEFIPRVSLEQSLLLRLEDIGRWAVRRRLVASHTVPNFLNLIHFDALQAVKPVAITVVR